MSALGAFIEAGLSFIHGAQLQCVKFAVHHKDIYIYVLSEDGIQFEAEEEAIAK